MKETKSPDVTEFHVSEFEIISKQSMISHFRELWHYRELLYFLIWRNIKIKYKQSLLGIAWALLQPLLSMGVMSFVFWHLAKMPSEGIPYPLFVLCGLVLWSCFSGSINSGTQSLIQNSSLITKVYFPRMLIPMATVGQYVVDFSIALILFFVVRAGYGISFSWNLLWAPFFIFLLLFLTLGVSLWTSAISVKYRDLPHTIPFMVQVWFWVSPVAYGIQVIPEHWRSYFYLNPLSMIMEGFRFACLSTSFSGAPKTFLCVGCIVVIFLSGVWFFEKTEREFADLI